MAQVVDSLACPPTRLETNSWPPVPRQLALVLSAAQYGCCFAIGSARPASGVLHAAPTADDAARWLRALSRAARAIAPAVREAEDAGQMDEVIGDLTFGDDTVPGTALLPGELVIHVLGATGLAATERDGTTDAYVVATVKGGRKTHKKQTAVVKGTCSPTWDAPLTFKQVPPPRLLCVEAGSPSLTFSRLLSPSPARSGRPHFLSPSLLSPSLPRSAQIWSEESQLVMHVKDWNYLMPSSTLGEVSFPLKRWAELPRDGRPITLILALHERTDESGKKLKRPPQARASPEPSPERRRAHSRRMAVRLLLMTSGRAIAVDDERPCDCR